MLLAIDVGNTNTVFAVYNGQELQGVWRCPTIVQRSADEYVSMLRDVFPLDKVSDVIVSSVVPDINTYIVEFSQSCFKKAPLFVSKDMVGISIDIDNPEEVGADRLVNVVAMKEHYETPAIVVDFGTATTFDVIDEYGHYAGGVIAPGVNLSVAALHQKTAQLPHIEVKKPAKAIGKNTVSAIQSGIYWGYVGLIEGIIRNITEEMHVNPFVLATGGLAPLFAEDSPVINQVDDELTLKGLLKLYQDQQT